MSSHGAFRPDDPAHAALAAELAAVLLADYALRRPGGAVVGVAGESGSGKSVTALGLAHTLRAEGLRVAVLHQDDYFLRPPRTNHAYRLGGFERVGAHEVNLALLAEHVAAFRARRSVVGPAVDYPNDRFLTRPLDLAAADVLVVEGTYVLRLPDLDARVFMAATHEDTRAARRARARDEVDTPFVERVLAIEHEVIARQAAGADVVVDPEFRVVRRGA